MIQPLHVDIQPHPAAAQFLEEFRQVARQAGHHRRHVLDAVHAALHHRIRRIAQPQHFLDEGRAVVAHVEFRIELTPQAFQGDQGLEQQGQVRWQHQMMLADHRRQLVQQVAETDVFQMHAGIIEDEFDHVRRQLALVHHRVAGPLQQHVQQRHFVLGQNRHQQVGDLVAALVREHASHAEIHQRNPVAAQVKHIAGVRVGVEVAVQQDHTQHDIGAAIGQHGQVQAGLGGRDQLVAGNAFDAFLHVHAVADVFPIHLGDEHGLILGELFAEALDVARLGRQIQLAPHRLAELLYHLARLVAPRLRELHLHQARDVRHDAQIGLDLVLDAGAAHLQDDRRAILQLGLIHLGNGSSGARRGVELVEHLARIAALQRQAHLRQHVLERQCRRIGLQLFQLGDPVRREQIDPRRQHLAQLDEGRPQFFQGLAKAHCGFQVLIFHRLLPMQHAPGAFQHAAHPQAPHQVAAAVADQDRGNFMQARQVAHQADGL